ncbi:MAG: chemotaxis protein CheV [Gammaproteobacteria bacterium]|nr:chemotaxis protein CheV [Gammaproteobacteria bacterium]
MPGVLDSVDSRTQLAGTNRLELLLFRLGGRQLYGINVFKVQEVIRCPRLSRMPRSHEKVVGVANLRNRTIPIMDLSLSINNSAIKNVAESFVIVTEYNRNIQGFLVKAVDRIANMTWKEILPPPKGSDVGSYLTAVTHVGDELVEIIDVEKIFADVMGMPEDVDEDLIRQAVGMDSGSPRRVMIVDDSSVARNQMKRVLEKAGIECLVANDGQQGYEMLTNLIKDGAPLKEHISMVISDIEMPIMDGYTLTTQIRKTPGLEDAYIMLHTSLSGVFNTSMVKKVGADYFVPKFKPDDLVSSVLSVINKGYIEQTG